MKVIITNGLIFDGTDFLDYDSILVRGDRIEAVSSFDNVKAREPAAKVIDVEGKLVTPGFIDSHCHLSMAGIYIAKGVLLHNKTSIVDIIEALQQKAKSTPKGSWIMGFGWDDSLIENDRKYLTRWDLDEISQDHPIVVEHISGHFLVANSAALKLAGITRDTPNPQGGLIDRDENGEPTGILYDEAMNLVLRLIPPPSLNELIIGIKKAQKMWLSTGFTSIEDANSFNARDMVIKAYKRVVERGELLLRTRVAYPLSGSELVEDGLGVLDYIRETTRSDNVIKGNLIKVFYDGSGLGRTALLYDDWCKDFRPLKGYRGIRVIDKTMFKTILVTAFTRKIRVAVHAIGDRAVDEVVETITSTTSSYSSRSERCQFSIVHAFLVTREAIELMSKHGICVKTQSSFIYSHGHAYAANFCLNRATRAFPLKTMIKNGVIVANSTDAPYVGMPNSGYGLLGAVYRITRVKIMQTNNILGVDERIDFIEALRTFTSYAALATGFENLVGKIRTGMKADIVVWNIASKNPSITDLQRLAPGIIMINGNIMNSPMPNT